MVFLVGTGARVFALGIDWQTDGISAALLDEGAFPLDASMRVAVIQWAHDPEEDTDVSRVQDQAEAIAPRTRR